MKRIPIRILTILMLLSVFQVQCAFAQEDDETTQVGSPPEYETFDELSGKRSVPHPAPVSKSVRHLDTGAAICYNSAGNIMNVFLKGVRTNGQ